jgi:hypothetical protein
MGGVEMTPLASWFRRDHPLSRTTAWICLLINLLLTPGLGSLVAGRLWSGLVELVTAFVGFGFVMAWFYNLFNLVSPTQIPFNAGGGNPETLSVCHVRGTECKTYSVRPQFFPGAERVECATTAAK